MVVRIDHLLLVLLLVVLLNMLNMLLLYVVLRGGREGTHALRGRLRGQGQAPRNSGHRRSRRRCRRRSGGGHVTVGTHAQQFLFAHMLLLLVVLFALLML
jgi:hypothetical protein